jgi:Flp pilus assembly CpaF family ATPase
LAVDPEVTGLPERAFVAGAKKGMRPTLTDAVEPVAVGEVRAEECVDPLLAMNAGLPGTTSLHSNKAGEALAKLCTLPLLAGESTSTLSGFSNEANTALAQVSREVTPVRRTPWCVPNGGQFN